MTDWQQAMVQRGSEDKAAGGGDDVIAHPAGIARLAHELRTPLAAITALSEVMRDERLGPLANPRYRDYATDINQSAQHALAVLTSYLEGGERLTEPVATSFAELLPDEEAQRSVSALRPVAERAGVQLELDCDRGLPRVIADRRSLRQILDNLIVNAVKFTPPGGQVQVVVRHTANGPLQLSVADTGDGMSPEGLARILDRCAAPERNAPRRMGSGIGLPLVRALAAANGGGLEIESDRGKGTRVTVTFGRDRLVI